MIIKTAFINNMTAHIVSQLTSAVYIKSGVSYPAVLTTDIEGSVVNIRVYLDESVSGTISGIRVIGNGTTYIEQLETFTKPSDRGYYKIFKINVKELEQ